MAPPLDQVCGLFVWTWSVLLIRLKSPFDVFRNQSFYIIISNDHFSALKFDLEWLDFLIWLFLVCVRNPYPSVYGITCSWEWLLLLVNGNNYNPTFVVLGSEPTRSVVTMRPKLIGHHLSGPLLELQITVGHRTFAEQNLLVSDQSLTVVRHCFYEKNERKMFCSVAYVVGPLFHSL